MSNRAYTTAFNRIGEGVIAHVNVAITVQGGLSGPIDDAKDALGKKIGDALEKAVLDCLDQHLPAALPDASR